MKNLLAAAMIIGTLALTPAALAAGNGPPSPYQNTGSASATLQGYTTSGPRVKQAEPQRLNDFDWTDAGIGAASGLGTALALIGVSLVVLRKRGRLAV
jgi:hypothetical protein